MIKGKIERLDRNGLIGWVAFTDDPSEKPQVEIVIDGEVIGRCPATRPRADVEAAGWGDGLSGVYIPIPQGITDRELERARIRVVGTELYLERPPQSQPSARTVTVSGASPVFIVGSPRSGTSILVDGLLAAGYSGFREGNLLGLIKPLFDSVDRHFQIHGGPDKRTLMGQLSSGVLKDQIANLFGDLLNRYNATEPWFDKTGNPETIYVLPELIALWPTCRIIFAKRRGIENVVSRIRKFPDKSFRFHCMDWAHNMAAWRETRARLVPDAFVEIDQRDLIIKPDEAANQIAELLGLTSEQRNQLTETYRRNRPQETRPGTAERVLSLDETGWDSDRIGTFMENCRHEMESFDYTLDDSYRLVRSHLAD